MQPYHELNYKAGTRQKILLFELATLAIITPNLETGYWQRGCYTSRVAKSLLNKEDLTLDEKIADFEPYVLRLEKDAITHEITNTGKARIKLNNLKKLKETIYATVMGI